MIADVKIARNDARRRFADTHDGKLRRLEIQEDRLNLEKDHLEMRKAAAAKAEELRDAQLKVRDKVKKELDDQREITAKQLERQTEKEDELFLIRVRLRDANQINQKLEEAIRSFERKSLTP